MSARPAVVVRPDVLSTTDVRDAGTGEAGVAPEGVFPSAVPFKDCVHDLGHGGAHYVSTASLVVRKQKDR